MRLTRSVRLSIIPKCSLAPMLCQPSLPRFTGCDDSKCRSAYSYPQPIDPKQVFVFAGFSSTIQPYPQQRLSIVVLSNLATYEPWELGNHIAADIFSAANADGVLGTFFAGS
jgi:hypothetical protein